MMLLDCHRFRRTDNNTPELPLENDQVVALEQLSVLSSPGPAQYQLVLITRLKRIAQKGHLKQAMSKPFYAASLAALPESVLEVRKALIAALEQKGFFFLDKVRINTLTGAIDPIDESVPIQTPQARLTWQLPLNPEFTMQAHVKTFMAGWLRETMHGAMQRLGLLTENEVLPASLFFRVPDRYEILWESRRLDAINPDTLAAVGELIPAHGHLPLLALWFLDKKLRASRYGKVGFASETGERVSITTFDDLKPLMAEFGFDPITVRKDAARLELVAEVIDLTSLDVDIDDDYF